MGIYTKLRGKLILSEIFLVYLKQRNTIINVSLYNWCEPTSVTPWSNSRGLASIPPFAQ